MAELSDRSGVPVATIKFYLRDGLLPAGCLTGATRAEYDDSHVRRLRLIRALVEVAGMRLEAVHAVLDALDDDRLSLHEVVGAAHAQLSEDETSGPPTESSLQRVERLIKRRRWRVSPTSGHRQALARALDSLTGLDQPADDVLLDEYARAMLVSAKREVSALKTVDAERATEMAVVGTLLLEPVLLSIRRMAQEHVSSRLLRTR